MKARTMYRRELLRAQRRAQRGGAVAEALVEAEVPRRPKTRSECKDGPRPCPFVGCRYNLYLDVVPRTGSIKINRPDLAPWEMRESCALDVAQSGAITHDSVGKYFGGITPQRAQQLVDRALAKLQAAWESF